MEQSTIELPAASSRESVEIMSSKFESMINDISARMNIVSELSDSYFVVGWC